MVFELKIIISGLDFIKVFMTIDLKYRKNRFEKLFSSKTFKNFEGLISFKSINKKKFDKIKIACIDFIIASFQAELKFTLNTKNSKIKMNHILKNIDKLYSITQNGFVVPKSHSYKEYNKLMKLYYNLFDNYGLKKRIDSWQDPIGICIKYYNKKKIQNNKNNRAYHLTSNSHIESWAGYSNLGINTLLPIFGNTKINYTEFYKPKKTFHEASINNISKGNYKKTISKNYFKTPLNKRLKKNYKCGNLVCWDNIILHNTKITNNFSFRIFIVNQFIPKLSKKEFKYNKISKYRKSELLKHDLISNKKSYLKFFKKDDYKFKSTLGGKRAATQFVLIK